MRSRAEQQRQKFREQLKGFRKGVGLKRRPYPEQLRELAIAYAEAKRAEGMSHEYIAKALGIAAMTLWSWVTPGAVERRSQQRKLRRAGKHGNEGATPAVRVLPVQLQGSSAANRSPAPQHGPVRVLPVQLQGTFAGLEVELVSGVRLRFVAGTEPTYIQAVLSALSAC